MEYQIFVVFIGFIDALKFNYWNSIYAKLQQDKKTIGM